MVDYPQAARVFEWARQVDPTRLQVRPLLHPCLNRNKHIGVSKAALTIIFCWLVLCLTGFACLALGEF